MSRPSTRVELGFVEPFEPGDTPLSATPFEDWDGGQVGGKPVWLKRSLLPDTESLKCGKCERTMPLLMQLSAPIDDDGAPLDAFHRMLYLFACTSGPCLNRALGSSDAGRSVVVLRCQVPEHAASVPGAVVPADSPACELCGLAAPNRCSKCRTVHYCSRDHQLVHWRLGHKVGCGAAATGQGVTSVMQGAVAAGCLFPELELVVETEPPLAERRALEEARLPAAARQAPQDHRSAATAPAPGDASRGLDAPQGPALAAPSEERKVLSAAAAAVIARASPPAPSDGSGAAAAAAADEDDDADGAAGSAGDGAEESDASLTDVTQRSLAQLTGARLYADRHMRYFQRRVASRPAQCVRYLRWPPPEEELRRPVALARSAASSASAAVPGASLRPVEEGSAAGSPGAAAPAQATGDGDEEEEEEDLDDAEGEGDDGEGLAGAPLWLSERFRAAPTDAATTPGFAEAGAAAGGGGASGDPSFTPRIAPPCPRCGGPRRFEFQILPQLLAQFPADRLAASDCPDFGTVAVYTCARSCSCISPAALSGSSRPLAHYAEEWAWVQPTLDEKGEAELEAARRLILG